MKIIFIIITLSYKVLIRGSVSVRIAIDIIIDENFSLSKTSKITLDVPTIITHSAFTNCVQKRLEIANVNCKNIFDSDNTNADDRHRLSLVGYILPDGTKALASLLQLLTSIHAIDKVLIFVFKNQYNANNFTNRMYLPHLTYCLTDLPQLSTIVVLTIR